MSHSSELSKIYRQTFIESINISKSNITQEPNINSSVVINSSCGYILTANTTLASNAFAYESSTFTMHNSMIKDDSFIFLTTREYLFNVMISNITNGSCDITIENATGSSNTSERMIYFLIF